eukprot:jgi/Tetstr1/438883/TSEL_027391.t2
MNDSKKGSTGGAKSVRGSTAGAPRSSRRTMAGVRSSRVGGSKNGRSSVAQSRAKGGGDRDRIVVLDDSGRDVTPKPMLTLKPTVLKGSQVSGMSAADSGSPQSEFSELPMDRMSNTGFSQAGFSESTNSTPKSEAPDEVDRAEEEANAEQVALDADAARAARGLTLKELFDHPDPLHDGDLEKDVFITLSESETFWMFDTLSLSVSSESADAAKVNEDNERYQKVLKDHEASDRFVEGEMQTLNLLQKQKEVQCLPCNYEDKDVQANVWAIYDAHAEQETNAEDQDDVAAGPGMTSNQLAAMSGHAKVSEGRPAGANATGGGSSAALGGSMVGGSQMYSMVGSSHFASTMGGSAAGNGIAAQAAAAMQDGADEEEPDPLAGVDREVLLETLQVVDSVLAQNTFLDKLLKYRNVKPLEIQESAIQRKTVAQQQAEEPEEQDNEDGIAGEASATTSVTHELSAAKEMVEEKEPQSEDGGSEAEDDAQLTEEEEEPEGGVDPAAMRMEQLWEFKCDITAGRNVACLGWNKVRKDMLAVGYGQYEFGKQKEGLVAFWSLKNPTYPLWHFKTHCGVTALDFSSKNGNILAVGMYDGTVAIYDVMTRQQTAAMESNHSSGKHSDPVWKMRWVEQVPDVDRLVTISTDGRISLWSITKGLEFSDLMKLKRVVPKQAAPTQGAAAANMNTEAFISRRASGMSFDFSSRDPRIYIAGTEDGPIHKCSTSYSEQYLETYVGHKGPVYNIQWSPFRPGLFVSCSADWTVRLWTEEKDTELLTFQSASEQVNDVQWCPTNSTVFGTVTNKGYIEVWDISVSTMKPVAFKRPAGRTKQNCLLFSDISPVVVCGSQSGGVSVYRLFNITHEDETSEEQKIRLDQAITANIVKSPVASM